MLHYLEGAMNLSKALSHLSYRLCICLFIFLLLILPQGCGGGTYGTGGSDASAILRSAAGTPIEGAILQGVGSTKSYTSKDDGSVFLPLNENFPLSPIRIKFIEGNEIYRYVNTDEAIAAKGPIIIEFDQRAGATVEANPETDTCTPKVDSWRAGVSVDGTGLSLEQRNAISRAIDNAQLQCEEKLQQIVTIAFTPTGGG